MNVSRFILMWVMGFIVAPFAVAAAAREDYANFFKGLHGLEGTFSQQVVDGNGHVKSQSRGQLALAFPRQFFWDETSPHPQQIIADGERIWIYEVELNQVTVRNQTSNPSDSALLVLTKPDQLDDWFRVEELAKPADGLHWLVLQPKQGHDASFSQICLGFSRKGMEKMDLTDSLGQKTHIQFGTWRRNPHFEASRFRFVPPPDADVIGP